MLPSVDRKRGLREVVLLAQSRTVKQCLKLSLVKACALFAALHSKGVHLPAGLRALTTTPHHNFTFIFIFQFQELGIKHPLHRKKLVLAVKAINTKQEEKSAQLDHIWVTRKDRHICIMFLTAPQSRQSFPVNMCLKDGCLLVKGGWISKPYGEYS